MIIYPEHWPLPVYGATRRRPRPSQRASLPLPATTRPFVLPQTTRSASRRQTTEPTDQRMRWTEAGRFWTGPCQKCTQPYVFARSGDTVVSTTRYIIQTILLILWSNKFLKLIAMFLFVDVLLGSTDYSMSLDLWGVGCIFVEMITGMPTFPGIRDTYDQLDKIFKLLGTPTEETWTSVTHLPGYKPHKLGRCIGVFRLYVRTF